MKFLTILTCLVAVAYGLNQEAVEKYKVKLLKYGEECKTEIGATEEDVAPLLVHTPPVTTKGKCALACMNKKIGFQDAAGKISKDGTYAAIEKVKADDEEFYEKMKQIADTCLAEVSDASDECETAVNMYNCVKKQKEVLGVVPIDFSS